MAAASGSGLLKGWLKNSGYDIDNVKPEDKKWSADIGNLILEDNRFYKKKIWSADDNEIPEDKRWSADIAHPILEDKSFFKQKKWSADDNVIPEFMRWRSSDIGKEILEYKRWSFHEEISKLFDHSLKASFPDFKEQQPLILASQEGEGESPGDYNCQNVLTIWPKLRKSPELRKTYPHIQKPRDIGEAIKKNLPAYASHMLDEDTSVEDVGFVAFALSRKWMAESIHKMLNDGIDTWAPKLPVERVLIAFPSLDKEIYVGLSRGVAIALTHFRMLKFSKVAAAFSLARDSAQ
ncbi:arginine--tRNA ligase, chloroplastic/mitochondrial, partial [Tanacetum coccineum]